MLVMRTTENLANPVGKLASAQQTLRLDHFALAVDPFGLHGVQPRALLGQQTANDSHSFPALFDLAVVFSCPSSHRAAYVPGSVVPNENPHLLASLSQFLAAPRKEPGRYATNGPTIHKAHPCLFEFG